MNKFDPDLLAALTELVAAIDKRWTGESARKRSNAISPRMEEALFKARAIIRKVKGKA